MTSDQVNTFLALMYPSGPSWIALCLIPPDTRTPEHRFTTPHDLRRFLAYARYRNTQGWGVYITPSLLKPNPGNRRKLSFQQQQSVIYLDCDEPQCLERIRHRYPYPTLVVRTSPGRHQVYWRLDDEVDIAAQERLMVAMAIDVGADRAATDVSRVLRLPGFWNRKPGRNNTVEIAFSRDHRVSYQSLLQTSQPARSREFPQDGVASTAGRGSAVLGGLPSRQPLSESERDWYEVHRRLANGAQPRDVVDWLETKRRDKHQPRYYAELTVSKAVQIRCNNR